jgi:lipopolysaccharide/colanic/teichoic acid biosynthesis glycosyltransferase
VDEGSTLDLALPVRIDAKIRPTPWLWATTQRGIALLLCVLLLPAAALLLIGVKLSSRGPFLFAQPRPGYRGMPFTVYKIRTMAVGVEDETALGTARGDPSITYVGSLLRELKLDELPQLWNVVRGDMELVGPRPIPIALDQELRAKIEYFELRYAVKPGLTNVSQVAVLDNKLEDRLVEDWRLRFEGELHYIKNKSFVYDVVVLLMTAGYVARKIFASRSSS